VHEGAGAKVTRKIAAVRERSKRRDMHAIQTCFTVPL
jgi:hypothetical protein